MQSQPFQFTPKLFVVIALVLAALILPIGMVIWGLNSQSSKKGEPLEPGELRETLNTIAEKGLPSANLSDPGQELKVQAVDVRKTTQAVSEVVKDLGGTSIDTETEESGMRMLISLPTGAYADFVRRLGVVTGQKIQPPQGEEPPSLVVLEVVPAGKP